MRHVTLFFFLCLGSSGFASTSIDCEQLMAEEANPALLQKLESGLLGEWNLARPRPDGRPALVTALRDPARGHWIFAEDERIALFAQQELQREDDQRVFRIDVRGPLDTEALVEIFSRLLTAYHGHLVETHEAPEMFTKLMRTEPASGESGVLIVWTFEPYSAIEGDRSRLWFDTFSTLGVRLRWKQIMVSDDPTFLKRIGITNRPAARVRTQREHH